MGLEAERLVPGHYSTETKIHWFRILMPRIGKLDPKLGIPHFQRDPNKWSCTQDDKLSGSTGISTFDAYPSPVAANQLSLRLRIC